SQGQKVIAVLLGNGDGSFQAPRRSPAGADVDSLTVVDVNADGRPDLVSRVTNGVSVLLGNGDGSFQAPRRAYAAGYVEALTVADVNADGRPDLLTSAHDPSQDQYVITVLLGNGDGSFQAPRDLAAGVVAFDSLTVADVNA